MTATTVPPALRRTAPPQRWSATRLLFLEMRRNPWPYLIPLVAILFYFDAYRAAAGYPAVWGVRASVIGNHLVPDLVPFAAGICAWTGSREARNNAGDLMTVTVRPAWARRGATLAATCLWVLAAFALFVAILYAAIATQTTWGGPPLWPVAVGAAELAAGCAIGFAVGAFVPSRYTAPLVAIGSFLVVIALFKAALNATSGYALLSPAASTPSIDIGAFYNVPDLYIVQFMFMGGIALAGVGALGLPAASRALRLAAAVITAAGLAAAGVGFGLAGTARLAAHGVVVPALHDAASDRPVPYPPDCGRSAGVKVCVNPAFGSYLQSVTKALSPVLAEVAGLPGAPAQVQQVAGSQTLPGPLMGSLATLGGNPATFGLPVPQPGGGLSESGFSDAIANDFITTYIAGSGAYAVTTGTPAQQAVETALLSLVGVQRPADAPPLPPDVAAAAQRFAALPAAARHAWLMTHMAALRAGHIALGQLP